MFAALLSIKLVWLSHTIGQEPDEWKLKKVQQLVVQSAAYFNDSDNLILVTLYEQYNVEIYQLSNILRLTISFNYFAISDDHEC